MRIDVNRLKNLPLVLSFDNRDWNWWIASDACWVFM